MAIWTDDTVEQREHDEEERENVCNDSKGWSESANPLTPTGLKKELLLLATIIIGPVFLQLRHVCVLHLRPLVQRPVDLSAMIQLHRSGKNYVSDEGMTSMRYAEHLEQCADNNWNIALFMFLCLVQ